MGGGWGARSATLASGIQDGLARLGEGGKV